MRILITGTSRGIGLELTKLALKNGHQVTAIARDSKKSNSLQELIRTHSEKLQIIDADLADPIAAFTKIKNELDGVTLDGVINNAGIMRQNDSLEELLESFKINSCVPFLLTQELLPFLKKSKSPKVAHMSSLMGSIQDNSSGGYYSYRASKAALNMLNKSLAIDHPWLTAVVFHPGWVKTDMGGAQAPLQAEESAQGLWRVFTELTTNESGRFFDYTGKELPW